MFGKGPRVSLSVASASSLLCLGSEQRPGDYQHMAERIERIDEPKYRQTQSIVGSATRWLLLILALMPSVAALNCSFDLGPIYSTEISPAFVQCEVGCDSCNFSLATGMFSYGRLECLPFVPCFVDVTTTIMYAMQYSTTNGTLASALNVDTSIGWYIWKDAVIHAPANRGDFRFEAADAKYALFSTYFYAEDSGKVDFVINSHDNDYFMNIELHSFFVFAKTAEELNIYMGEDTRYARDIESTIECPAEGKCTFHSKGQYFDSDADYMTVLNFITYPNTELLLECNNSKACAGIEVHCGYSLEPSCDLQYDANNDSDWQCVGSLDLTNGCPAALICAIDLSLIRSSETYPKFAQCDDGCDSCNFSLLEGNFEFGTVECLASVPCLVDIKSGEYGSMKYSTVKGSLAAALIVATDNAVDPWYNAVFHAPANRGDFRFEANNSLMPLQRTTIHAVNSGVVDFVVGSDNRNDAIYAELMSAFIFASTADELNIWLGEDTRYAKYFDSVIQCPKNGKCNWVSNGQRYDAQANYMKVVNVLTYPSTDLEMFCDDSNNATCAGIEVECNTTAETCEMQYDSDWQCVGNGTFDLANGCPAPLRCDVNLSLITSSQEFPGFAQCRADCDSCSFSLATGLFQHGTMECLPFVPCFVDITTDEFAAILKATVNGSLASALTVGSNNAYHPFPFTVFHAPANRGDFRLDARNTTNGALYRTEIYAENTGVVDIFIGDGGINDRNPELHSMHVFASTADALNIFLAEDTLYAYAQDSNIHCPNEGKCKWESNGQRYDENADWMHIVSLYSAPTTDLQMICGNSKACAGIEVHCNGTADTCQMQYASDWQCVGTLDLATECAIITTTTTKPTTTTKTPTFTSTALVSTSTTKIPSTTTLKTTKRSTTKRPMTSTAAAELSSTVFTTLEVTDDNDNSGFLAALNAYGGIGWVVFVVVLMCLALALCAYVYNIPGVSTVLFKCGLCKVRRVEETRAKALGTLAFQIWDVYSDILLCVSLWRVYGSTALPPLVSTTFVVLPFVASFVSAVNVLKTLQSYAPNNEAAAQRLHKRRAVFIMLVTVTSSVYTAISLFNARLFGVQLFCMGLTNGELAIFEAQRVFTSVLLENVPQFILQIYLLAVGKDSDNGSFKALVYMSMTSSLIMIFTAVGSFLGDYLSKAVERQFLFTADFNGQCDFHAYSQCHLRFAKLLEESFGLTRGRVNIGWINASKRSVQVYGGIWLEDKDSPVAVYSEKMEALIESGLFAHDFADAFNTVHGSQFEMDFSLQMLAENATAKRDSMRAVRVSGVLKSIEMTAMDGANPELEQFLVSAGLSHLYETLATRDTLNLSELLVVRKSKPAVFDKYIKELGLNARDQMKFFAGLEALETDSERVVVVSVSEDETTEEMVNGETEGQ